MKKLKWYRRPYFAKTILEVGGGHDPYEGVTHALDKFPDSNRERAGNLQITQGVEFKEGDVEAIPFFPEKNFDFIYVSHVLEHVYNPEKAISEINRVASQGYLATPSPLREQLVCPNPYDERSDYHRYYCWTTKSQTNTLNVIRKTADRVGEYCNCKYGKLGKYLFHLQRTLKYDLEPMMPGCCKETSLYFSAPIKLVIHPHFQSACAQGVCAYTSANELERWTTFPWKLTAKRFRDFRKLLISHRSAYFELEELSDTTFENHVLKSTHPTVVAFWANWSGASQALAPTLAELEIKYSGKCRFFGINTDKNPVIPRRFSIQTIPSVLIFHKGTLIKELSGNQSKEVLLDSIHECLI